SDVPVYDITTDKGRDELNFSAAVRKGLEGVAIFPLRLRAGDDASCLNLYQPRRPRLLGLPRPLVRRGGFRFAASTAETPEDRANPWRLLERPDSDGAIPAVADATTVEWMLKSKLGGVLEVPDEQGNPVKLRLVGLLQESIFQSEVLVSEENFLRLYPSQEGYNFFLIEAPPGRSEEVKTLLETALAERGFEAASTAQRLAAYLAVENTYLSTFQALGGLGLLLGALGLAV